MAKTTWGSFFAALAGMLGSVASFVPAPYQVYVGVAAGVAGAIATKIP